MERIGRYEIIRELGRGSGGRVYLGEDPKMGRKVAIKTILAAGGVGGETLLKRLQREARSAAALAHPNIVTVFEMAEDGPTTFVVMEFVEGHTLESAMKLDGGLARDAAIGYLEQIAEGLDFAGARGVVHRDIKPANILITEDGVVKIADFGVAKVLGDASMTMTTAGMAIGTPHYMSPEQVIGKPVEGRSDQFSLGVVAYEMLAHRRPFEGESITSLLYQIVNEDPPAPEDGASPFPPRAVECLLRAMAKEPQDRFPTSREVVRDLRRALRGAPAAPAPQPAAAASLPAAPAPVAVPALVPAALPVPVAAAIPAPPPVSRLLLVLIGVLALVVIGLLVLVLWEPGSRVAPAAAVARPVPQAAKPVPAPPPAAKPKTEAVAAKPAAPNSGSFTWSGALASGGALTIEGNQPSSGAIAGAGLPLKGEAGIQTDPPDVRVVEEPSAGNGYKLLLVNDGRPASSFTVYWKKARIGK